MKTVDQYTKDIWDNTDIPSCVDALIDADTAVGTIASDMYEQLSGIAHQITAEDSHGIERVQSVFRQFEKEYKKKKGVRAMPSSYRSAKSVVLNALKNGIELTDEWDNPKGKTAVEKEIKVARKKSAETVEQRICREAQELAAALNKWHSSVDAADPGDVPLTDVRHFCDWLEQRAKNIRHLADVIDKRRES